MKNSKSKSNKKKAEELSGIITLRGCIEGHLRDAQGNPLQYFRSKNTVVTSGRAWVLNRIASTDANIITSIDVGTGTTAPATGDTALGSSFLRKAIGTMSMAGTASNPPFLQAQVSYATNEATTTLGEAGLFNSSSAGTMLTRVTFTTINKTTLTKWGRSIVKWMREFALIDSNPEMVTRGKQGLIACAA